MEDDDGDNVADNGVYYGLSYADLCREEKDHQHKKKVKINFDFLNDTVEIHHSRNLV